MTPYWKFPDNELPDVDWDYPGDIYVSVRVIVEWTWINEINGQKKEFSFARFYWDSQPRKWIIEGVNGNTTVHRWLDPNKVI